LQKKDKEQRKPKNGEECPGIQKVRHIIAGRQHSQKSLALEGAENVRLEQLGHKLINKFELTNKVMI